MLKRLLGLEFSYDCPCRVIGERQYFSFHRTITIALGERFIQITRDGIKYHNLGTK